MDKKSLNELAKRVKWLEDSVSSYDEKFGVLKKQLVEDITNSGNNPEDLQKPYDRYEQKAYVLKEVEKAEIEYLEANRNWLAVNSGETIERKEDVILEEDTEEIVVEEAKETVTDLDIPDEDPFDEEDED